VCVYVCVRARACVCLCVCVCVCACERMLESNHAKAAGKRTNKS
jgi:hypothetical protein